MTDSNISSSGLITSLLTTSALFALVACGSEEPASSDGSVSGEERESGAVNPNSEAEEPDSRIGSEEGSDHPLMNLSNEQVSELYYFEQDTVSLDCSELAEGDSVHSDVTKTYQCFDGDEGHIANVVIDTQEENIALIDEEETTHISFDEAEDFFGIESDPEDTDS